MWSYEELYDTEQHWRQRCCEGDVSWKTVWNTMKNLQPRRTNWQTLIQLTLSVYKSIFRDHRCKDTTDIDLNIRKCNDVIQLLYTSFASYAELWNRFFVCSHSYQALSSLSVLFPRVPWPRCSRCFYHLWTERPQSLLIPVWVWPSMRDTCTPVASACLECTHDALCSACMPTVFLIRSTWSGGYGIWPCTGRDRSVSGLGGFGDMESLCHSVFTTSFNSSQLKKYSRWGVFMQGKSIPFSNAKLTNYY